MMSEVWKDVVGYEGLYQVSDMGNVKRLGKTITRMATDKREGKYYQGTYEQVIELKEKVLKGTYSEKGYLKVGLVKDGKQKSFFIHRLVAIAFISNPENKREVNHKDGTKTNNKLDNLEWATGKENNDHAINTGLHKSYNILSEDDKEWIIDNYVYGSRTHGIIALGKKFNVTGRSISRLLKKHKS